MSKIRDRLVRQLKAKGMSAAKSNATATKVLQKSGNLKKGSTKPTAKGKKRGKMTPAARSADRASKKSGRKASDYKYKRKNNTSVLKKT